MPIFKVIKFLIMLIIIKYLPEIIKVPSLENKTHAIV